jgi:hypothetical protein
MTNGNGTQRVKDWILGLLVLGAVVGAGAWMTRGDDREAALAAIGRERKKYTRVSRLVEENWSRLAVSGDEAAGPGTMAGRPAISIIREIASECGISEKLIRVIPEENRKRREMTAKVVLKGVKLEEIVSFLVRLRSSYPDVYDREARIRLAARGKDRWDAGLALTYAVANGS